MASSTFKVGDRVIVRPTAEGCIAPLVGKAGVVERIVFGLWPYEVRFPHCYCSSLAVFDGHELRKTDDLLDI